MKNSEQNKSNVIKLSILRENRLRIVLVLNIIIVITQVIFGLISRSLGLLADAGHNLTDVGAIVLSIIAIRLMRRDPTEKRPFGYHRAGVLATQANALVLIFVTALLTYEGIHRLFNPENVKGALVLIVALLGAFINISCVFILREKNSEIHNHSHKHKLGTSDMNMQSAIIHLLADGLFSLGVGIAGLIIFLTNNFYWLDPAISLVISLYIAYEAVKMIISANEILLESTPSNIDLDEIAKLINVDEGVDEVHDLHVWSLSSDVIALSAHLVIEGHRTLEDAQDVGKRIKSLLTEKYNISHLTLELECENCIINKD